MNPLGRRRSARAYSRRFYGGLDSGNTARRPLGIPFYKSRMALHPGVVNQNGCPWIHNDWGDDVRIEAPSNSDASLSSSPQTT